jgi:SNF2 family DNA or RNA helicase
VLFALANATDAELFRITPDSRIGRAIAGKPIPELKLPPLPTGHPHPLMTERPARPYQRADIAMMATENVMNANQPGVGKTIETIGSWVEADIVSGPHLVIAPVKSLENVWLTEIMMWLPDLDVYTAEEPLERKQQIREFIDSIDDGAPKALCINHDFIRLVKIVDNKGRVNTSAILRCGEEVSPKFARMKNVFKIQSGDECKFYRVDSARSDYKGNKYAYHSKLQKELFEITFTTVTVDEFHKAGLNNRNTLFTLGLDLVKTKKKAALSGTPMGGKPRKLWPVLHWLDPSEFGAEGRWINKWLEVSDNGHGKVVGGIQSNKEKAFYIWHSRRIVRRLKLDALPGLPPRVEQVVWCNMTPNQRTQYIEFERRLEIRIDEERLSATNVLSEYMRLKQFANAKQQMKDGVPHPTIDSGKLDHLWFHLEENGISYTDPEPGARAIVGSESKRMVDMILTWLRSKSIACDALTGDTKDSKPILEKFKQGGPEPYVIVMTVQTGGISLNLEEAGSMHAIDETWNPDDIEQFFDRGDRGSRTTPLRCYIYRTRGTIQEYIAEVNEGKSVTNKNVLDIRRRMHDEGMV